MKRNNIENHYKQKKLEAQKALLEAEELESMVSMKSMSRTSRRKSTTQAENGSVNFLRIGSGTNRSIKRPSASTPIVRLQPTSFLQGVTPLRGIFSDDNSSDRKSHAASLPPSYATHDPIDYGSVTTGNTLQHSFTFEYHERPQQEKTMTGNDTDPEQPNDSTSRGRSTHSRSCIKSVTKRTASGGNYAKNCKGDC